MAFERDRKSTRLNSSHVEISYAVFCLKKRGKPWARQGVGRGHSGGLAVRRSPSARESDATRLALAVGGSTDDQHRQPFFFKVNAPHGNSPFSPPAALPY